MLGDGLTARELADAVDRATQGRLSATLRGNPEQRVRGLAPLGTATASDLSFLANPRYRHEAAQSAAGLLVLSPEDQGELFSDQPTRNLVVCAQPYAWFAFAAQHLKPPERVQAKIASNASISEDARIDPSARVDEFAVIAAGARIGAQAHIGAGAYVGEGAEVGAETKLAAGVKLMRECRVGARCIVHSGVVIGADGFGFAPFEGRWIKIPQTGAAVIGDDVEIGANTTIDRGAMGDTIVEDGVKLDNQVQIGHNCRIGAHTIISGCVGIAGSAIIGRNCMIGGAAMIGGHLTIADGCAIGPCAVVYNSIETAAHYMGFFPIMKNRDWERSAALIRHLGDLRDRIRKLEAQARSGNT